MNLVFNCQTLGLNTKNVMNIVIQLRNNFQMFAILMNFIKIQTLNTHKK